MQVYMYMHVCVAYTHVHIAGTYACRVFLSEMIISFLEYLGFTRWVDNLRLSMADREILSNGRLLTANHISAANTFSAKDFQFKMAYKIPTI